VSHANARTNVFARRLIVERVAAGWPPARVAEQLGISRATVYKWLHRYAEGGDAALVDRSSRPHRMPLRTDARMERAVLALRRRRKRGAVVLAAELGLNPSTVGRILARHAVAHLSAIDPITGEPVRTSRRSANRYQHRTPGSMIHIDVKKLGRIPNGGGWRLHGRAAAISVANRHKRIRIGYDYVHSAIDDYTRLAYSEVLPRREGPHLRWIPAPGDDLVRHPRHPRAASAHRQRHGLPPRIELGLGMHRLATQTPIHPARLPLDQRQSRALQPDPAHRMGLRASLVIEQPAHPSA
jgi:transposase